MNQYPSHALSRRVVLPLLILLLGSLLGSHHIARATTTSLTSSGGSTMQSTTTYTIFWLPAGTTYEASGTNASYESLLQRFFTDVGGTSFYNILSQYPNGSGISPSPTSTLAGTYTDTTAFPAAGTQQQPLHDSDIQAAVSRAMAAKGWTASPSTAFFVFTPDNVQVCTDSSNSQCSWNTFCAYHSSFSQNGISVLYAALPDAGQNGGTCQAKSPSGTLYAPNGDAVADSAVSLASQELFALVTDPQGDGWTDPSGAEIGDLCDWTYGAPAADGSNVTLSNADKYIVQQEWSNAEGACALSYGSLPAPTPTPTATSTPNGTPTPTPLPATRLTPTPIPGAPTPTPTPVPNIATRLTPTPLVSASATPTPTPVPGVHVRSGPLRAAAPDFSVSRMHLRRHAGHPEFRPIFIRFPAAHSARASTNRS